MTFEESIRRVKAACEIVHWCGGDHSLYESLGRSLKTLLIGTCAIYHWPLLLVMHSLAFWYVIKV